MRLRAHIVSFIMRAQDDARAAGGEARGPTARELSLRVETHVALAALLMLLQVLLHAAVVAAAVREEMVVVRADWTTFPTGRNWSLCKLGVTLGAHGVAFLLIAFRMGAVLQVTPLEQPSRGGAQSGICGPIAA